MEKNQTYLLYGFIALVVILSGLLAVTLATRPVQMNFSYNQTADTKETQSDAVQQFESQFETFTYQFHPDAPPQKEFIISKMNVTDDIELIHACQSKYTIFEEPLSELQKISKREHGYAPTFACVAGNRLFVHIKSSNTFKPLQIEDATTYRDGFEFHAPTLYNAPQLMNAFAVETQHGNETISRLYVAFETPDCFGSFGLCIDSIEKYLVYDTQNDFALINSMDHVLILSPKLIFNPSQTKYFGGMYCAEGCPDAIITAHNTETGKTEQFQNTISREKIFLGELDEKNSYWIDDNTMHVEIVSKEGVKEIKRQTFELTF